MFDSVVQSNAAQLLASGRARLAVLALFMLAVLLGGGASRDDALSLVYLRPASFLAIGYALIVISKEEFARLSLPFYLLLGLMGLMALQLVPLPYSMWTKLPGREIFAEIAALEGLPEQARPLTLTPARTWNALFSLGVPIATFLLLAIQPRRFVKFLPWLLLLAAVTSVGVGILQAMTGQNSPFYLYRVHTDGQMVGLFANRNHQGLFLAVSILMAGIVLAQLDAARRWSSTIAVLVVGYVVILIPFVLVLGSRAALVLTVLAVAAVPLVALKSPFAARLENILRKNRFRLVRKLRLRPLVFGLTVAIGGLVAALSIFRGRSLSFDRLSDSGADMPLGRSQVFSSLVEILDRYFPWGTGFGSFEAVFKRHEPGDALSTFYLNQAHNDWLQILIEGGLPAGILLAAFVGWVGLAALRGRTLHGGTERVIHMAWVLAAVFIGIASAPDYPLRVPIVMMLLSAVVFAISEGITNSRGGITNRPAGS